MLKMWHLFNIYFIEACACMYDSLKSKNTIFILARIIKNISENLEWQGLVR